MKKNYLSEFTFKLRLTDASGKELGFPRHDWVAELRTSGERAYKVSYLGGVCSNCREEDGEVLVIMQHHGLAPGTLWCRWSSFLPNGLFASGVQRDVEPMALDIELVSGAGDEATEAEVSATLSYIYVSSYEEAVAAGYTGTQEEYQALMNRLPTAIETADSIKETAQALQQTSDRLDSTTATLTQVSDVLSGASDGLTSASAELKEGAETIVSKTTKIDEAAESLASTAEALTQVQSTIVGASDSLVSADKSLSDTVVSLEAKATRLDEATTGLTSVGDTLTATADTLKGVSKAMQDDAIGGRKLIAEAIVERGGDASATDSYAELADKTRNLPAVHVLTAIGYGNEDAIDEIVTVGKQMQELYATQKDLQSVDMFRYVDKMIFMPYIDLNDRVYTSCENWWRGQYAMRSLAPNMDFGKVNNLSYAFYYCTSLREVSLGDLRACTTLANAFNSCTSLTRIDGLDFSSVTTMTGWAYGTVITYLRIKNLGKSSLTTYTFTTISAWGADSEENRQTLVDSLLTDSYDRATNGMATATIQLHANAKARLTDEEIAAITAKGYTIS